MRLLICVRMENIDLVSIVVPIYNVEEYLEQCLHVMLVTQWHMANGFGM